MTKQRTNLAAPSAYNNFEVLTVGGVLYISYLTTFCQLKDKSKSKDKVIPLHEHLILMGWRGSRR